jgi:hypothetical protein
MRLNFAFFPLDIELLSMFDHTSRQLLARNTGGSIASIVYIIDNVYTLDELNDLLIVCYICT